MLKTIRRLPPTLLLCSASMAAQANSTLEAFLLKSYIEVHVGSASNSLTVETEDASFTRIRENSATDEFDDVFSVGVTAGYDFVEERNLALSWELSYQAFAETTGGSKFSSPSQRLNLESDLFWHSVGAALRAKISLNNSLSAFAKLGFHQWYADIESTEELTDEIQIVTNFPSSDPSGSDVYYGAGFQYHVNRNLYAGLELSSFKINPFEERGSVRSTALSLGFSF